MIVYLAGGMKDGWQDRAAALLPGCELLDPRSWGDPNPIVYTARDLDAIRKADVVLAHMSSANPSGFGLSVEVGYAYGIGKRIVFCDEIGGDWRSPYFGMHRVMATAVAHSLAEAASMVLRP